MRMLGLLVAYYNQRNLSEVRLRAGRRRHRQRMLSNNLHTRGQYVYVYQKWLTHSYWKELVFKVYDK